MHNEISALIGAIAKAFTIPEAKAIEAAERGVIKMDRNKQLRRQSTETVMQEVARVTSI